MVGRAALAASLSYYPFWWTTGDSNPVPPGCKAGALPGELDARGVLGGTRTRDLRGFNSALYRLSYRDTWRRGRDSNPRSPGCNREPETARLPRLDVTAGWPEGHGAGATPRGPSDRWRQDLALLPG